MTQSSRPLEQTGHEQARPRPLCRPGARSDVQTVTASRPRAAGEAEAAVTGSRRGRGRCADRESRAAGKAEAAVQAVRVRSRRG